jgi:virginiamycin B lyase
MTAGPDGNIWFTETMTDKIGVLITSTHTIREFSIPGGGAGILRPGGIATGPDGNIWFTESSAGKIGEVVL